MQGSKKKSDENQWSILDRLFAWRHSHIHSAAYAGNRYAVHQFLTNDPSTLEALDDYQHTPLHLAASVGHAELVNDLIQLGANIHARSKHGRTPLDLAAASGQLDSVEILGTRMITQNADATCFKTALLLAIIYGHLDVVKKLHALAPDIMIFRYNHGQTPLHLAARFDRAEITKYFLDNGKANVNINETNDNQETPLMVTKTFLSFHTAQLLRTYGATLPTAPPPTPPRRHTPIAPRLG